MKSRPDTPAILGLIGLAGLVIVGWIILTALGKSVPGEAWGLVLTLAGIVGGWVGKTLTSEPVAPVEVVEPGEVITYRPNPELLQQPDPQPGDCYIDTSEVHPPNVNNIAERQRISEYLAGDEFIAGPDVHG